MRVISLLSHDSVSLRSSDRVRPTVPKEARQPENTGEVSNLFSDNVRDKHDHQNENSAKDTPNTIRQVQYEYFGELRDPVESNSS
eukprot:15346898-Ditylum_brightwellii.AAC.1